MQLTLQSPTGPAREPWEEQAVPPARTGAAAAGQGPRLWPPDTGENIRQASGETSNRARKQPLEWRLQKLGMFSLEVE